MDRYKLLAKQMKPAKVQALAEALITGGDPEIDAYVDARALTVAPYFPRLSGQIYDTSSGNGGSTANFTLPANRLVAAPLYVPEPITVDRVGFEVLTLASGASLDAHLYHADSVTGRPGAFVTTLGTVSVAATGSPAITGLSVAMASPNDIPFVWLVIESGGAPVLRGFTPAMSLLGSDGQQAWGHVYAAHTYGTALPDPFGAATPSVICPRITARVA